MLIFQVTKKKYAILGISAEQSLQKYPFTGKHFLSFILLGYSNTSHFLYLFYIASTFKEYIECISTTFAIFVISVCFTTMVLNMLKLFTTINDIENLIDERLGYPVSKALFNKTNQQVERCSEFIFFIIARVSPPCYVLPKAFFSLFIYFTTDVGEDAFMLPLPTWLPFDWKSPIGYLMAVFIQFITVAYEFFVIACTLALAIGAFWFAMAATKEIKRIVHTIDEIVKYKKDEKTMYAEFSYFIHGHSVVKQVAHNFSEVFQPIFMILFTWSLIAICGAMLMIQMQISQHDYNVMVLSVTVFVSCYAFCTLFIACELGQRLNDAFGGITYMMCKCDWQLFPIKAKRMLPAVLSILQQPVSLQCFGSILCTREVFKEVVNHAFSYFMMLRQLHE